MEILDLNFVFKETESENIQWSFLKNGYGILKKQKNKIFVYEKSECMWIIDSIYFLNRNDFKIYKLSCLISPETNYYKIDSVKCVSDEIENIIDEDILCDFVQKEAEKKAGK